MEKPQKVWAIVPQFSKFVIVGTLNTAVDFIFYGSLTRTYQFWVEHYLWANLLAFFLANVLSFIINKHWTFNDQGIDHYAAQYGKFFLVSLGALILVELSLFVGVEIFGLVDWWGKGAGVILSLLWSFVWHRYWTFSKIKN